VGGVTGDGQRFAEGRGTATAYTPRSTTRGFDPAEVTNLTESQQRQARCKSALALRTSANDGLVVGAAVGIYGHPRGEADNARGGKLPRCRFARLIPSARTSPTRESKSHGISVPVYLAPKTRPERPATACRTFFELGYDAGSWAACARRVGSHIPPTPRPTIPSSREKTHSSIKRDRSTRGWWREIVCGPTIWRQAGGGDVSRDDAVNRSVSGPMRVCLLRETMNMSQNIGNGRFATALPALDGAPQSSTEWSV